MNTLLEHKKHGKKWHRIVSKGKTPWENSLLDVPKLFCIAYCLSWRRRKWLYIYFKKTTVFIEHGFPVFKRSSILEFFKTKKKPLKTERLRNIIVRFERNLNTGSCHDISVKIRGPLCIGVLIENTMYINIFLQSIPVWIFYVHFNSL